MTARSGSSTGGPRTRRTLTARVCDGLGRLLDHGAALELACLQLDDCSTDDTAVAYGVAVLTHESVHMRGVMDEAATECEAVSRSAGVAQALGATSAGGGVHRGLAVLGRGRPVAGELPHHGGLPGRRHRS